MTDPRMAPLRLLMWAADWVIDRIVERIQDWRRH